MRSALNNVTAPDAYSEEATAVYLGTTEIIVLVSNQSIWLQRGHGLPGGSIEWNEPEEFLPPNNYTLDKPRYSCDAVRIRAAVPEAELPPARDQAQVTVKLA